MVVDDTIEIKGEKWVPKKGRSEKFCPSCQEIKPLAEFYFLYSKKRDKNYYSSDCRACAGAKRMDRDKRVKLHTPPWADLKEIRRYYQIAKDITRNSGTRMSVDHIIPLKGKNFCGLHVEYNLRVITWRANVIKNNKLYDDIEYVPIESNKEKNFRLRREIGKLRHDKEVHELTADVWDLDGFDERLDKIRRETLSNLELNDRRKYFKLPASERDKFLDEVRLNNLIEAA